MRESQDSQPEQMEEVGLGHQGVLRGQSDEEGARGQLGDSGLDTAQEVLEEALRTRSNNSEDFNLQPENFPVAKLIYVKPAPAASSKDF